MDAAFYRLRDRGRHLLRGFDGDALEREIDLEHARERLRLVDPDLRTCKRRFARLEHDALVSLDRLVARVARDVDIADSHASLRRRWLRRSLGSDELGGAHNEHGD